MLHYCTYFDEHYLTRGIALYKSLLHHKVPFTLWVLCLDEQTELLLSQVELPHIRPIAHRDFECNDPELAWAKLGRSRMEYYFTCTPSWLCYLFDHYAEIDLLTYLDADLLFFASPEPMFEELGSASIQLIEHRFPPRLHQLRGYGRFNVGWVSVRRDTTGLAFSRWWRERCLEWCYMRLEENRYADQGYLNEVEARFGNVNVVCHPGANLALWNIEGVRLTYSGGQVLVNGHTLLFYHYHNLRQIGPGWYNMGVVLYDLKPLPIVYRQIYSPYLIALASARYLLTTHTKQSGPRVGWPNLKRLFHELSFQRSLVIIGKKVIYVDVMKLFRPVAKVWRLFKLVTREIEQG